MGRHDGISGSIIDFERNHSIRVASFRSQHELLYLEAKMAQEMTLEELSLWAVQAGLKLTRDELQCILPGVHRSRIQVAELRGLMTDNLEPAGVFLAQKGHPR
jgi:hypothetical protein